MFKLLYRCLLPKNLNDYDLKFYMLLKDQWKLKVLVRFMLNFILFFPLSTSISFLIIGKFKIDDLIFGILYTLVYIFFILCFTQKHKESIELFHKHIVSNCYTSNYTFKGNALSADDFKIIEEKDKLFYSFITSEKCRGYCYAMSFHILQYLKKGEIKFLAIRATKADRDKEYYTMHVVYVNNGWCFDTYSQRQYPLDEHLNFYEAKEYMSFSYKDVENMSYEEFTDNNYADLAHWCLENDCYQKWVE